MFPSSTALSIAVCNARSKLGAGPCSVGQRLEQTGRPFRDAASSRHHIGRLDCDRDQCMQHCQNRPLTTSPRLDVPLRRSFSTRLTPRTSSSKTRLSIDCRRTPHIWLGIRRVPVCPHAASHVAQASLSALAMAARTRVATLAVCRTSNSATFSRIAEPQSPPCESTRMTTPNQATTIHHREQRRPALQTVRFFFSLSDSLFEENPGLSISDLAGHCQPQQLHLDRPRTREDPLPPRSLTAHPTRPDNGAGAKTLRKPAHRH